MNKLCLLLAAAGLVCTAASGQVLSNLFFLHHSCGSNLISQGHLRDTLSVYNAGHGTGYGFWDHGYNSQGLRDTAGQSTGRTYSIPGDNTNPDGLHTLFTTVNGARDSIMGNHEVIAFKSCYPACNIPDTSALHQYKVFYVEMRDSFFDLHPEKIFVVMSPPPLHRLATNTTCADNARAFADWLKSDEYLSGYWNLRCFDLFDHMAHPDDGSPVRNMLKYDYEISHSGSNSHPNTLANLTVAPRFVYFLCDSIGQGDSVDVGVSCIVAPAGEVPCDSVVYPEVVVHNFGTDTISCSLRLVIDDRSDGVVYDTVECGVVLPGGDSVVHVFTLGWTATPTGSCNVSAWTILAGDVDPSNDTAFGTCEVVPGPEPDVAVDWIVSPRGYVDTAATVSPAARVRNLGNVELTFTVWFVIRTGSGTEVFRDWTGITLAPGLADTVAYPPWPKPHPAGQYTGTCSLAVSDVQPGNDTLSCGFFVTAGPIWPVGWHEVSQMPSGPSGRPVKRGGWLDVDRDGSIYMAKGYKTADFYAHHPVTHTWRHLAPIPRGAEGKLPDKGCRGVTDRSGHFWMTKGANSFGFWHYQVADDTWDQIEFIPEGPRRKKVKGGTDLAYAVIGDTGWVYLLKGYKTEFYKFNATRPLWSVLPDAPTGIKYKWDKGSWLCYDGEHTIYAHKAKYYYRTPFYQHEFWKFDIRGDTWYSTRLNGMPLYGLHSGRIKKKKARDGGAGAWFDGAIYALKGGNTQQFWRYDVAGDTWTEQDTVPNYGSTGRKKRVKYGADIAHFGAGTFFALKGNKTRELWRYVVPVSTAEPGGEESGVLTSRSVQAGRTATAGVPGVQVIRNPVTTTVARLRYGLPGAGSALITVYDAAGRECWRRTVAGVRGVVEFDARGLSRGVYYVRLDGGGCSASCKLVLQR